MPDVPVRATSASASPARPLRICLDARLVHGQSGGVEQVVLGLAHAFSRIDDGNEEYFFLTIEGEDDWIARFLRGPCTRLSAPLGAVSKLGIAFPRLARAYANLLWRPSLGASDGLIESRGIDVMHFTSQNGFRTSIPSVYHPHDLQHLHFPEFFDRSQLRWREAFYGPLCRQAATVAVATNWVKRDVVEQFGVEPGKVVVIPLAPIIQFYRPASAETTEALRARLALPDQFLFFPAQTWPHKNHTGLLDALARVRDERGVTLPLVCTGRLTEYEAVVRAHARRLGLERSLHLLGFVSSDDLKGLYGLARGIVIPTLFEAASFPLWEAFESGVPAACSNVTSLPEQAGAAALLFDPKDTRGMADAIWQLWSDDALRQRLIQSGRDRIRGLTWDRTARIFRAHYRRIAGRTLSAADRALFAAPTEFDSPLIRPEGVGGMPRSS